jgi:hypothetical protein
MTSQVISCVIVVGKVIIRAVKAAPPLIIS